MDQVMMQHFFYVLSALAMMGMSFGYQFVGLNCDRRYWTNLGARVLAGLGDLPNTSEGICVAALNGLDRLRQAEQEASEVIRTVTGPAKTEDEIEELRRRQ